MTLPSPFSYVLHMQSHGVVPRGAGLAVLLALVAQLCATLSAQDPSKQNSALDRALDELPKRTDPGTIQAPRQDANPVRLMDLSLDALFAVGTSTVRDAKLSELQGGDHDPRKRGFTFQQLELSAAAAVDPYFQAESHLVYLVDPYDGESRFELEEAFGTTSALPHGLQVKAGHFQTEFGRHNAQHPHAWEWQDAPVIAARVFGPDGMRGTGARLSWLLPTQTYVKLSLGVQNSNGETMTSFGSSTAAFDERPLGGRFFEEREVRTFRDVVWHARGETGSDLDDEWNTAGGASIAYGGNALGSHSESVVWGVDATLRWRPVDHARGWPFVKLTAELMVREAEAAEQIDENDPTVSGDEVTLPATTLKDRGLYVQGLWGFQQGWAAGLRWDWATAGGGDSYSVDAHAFTARSGDPFRNDRTRIAPLLVWHPSEYSRLRFQYNYDRADHLSGSEAHSVWLGFEITIGAHPAHKY